jgi:hypothetical protein
LLGRDAGDVVGMHRFVPDVLVHLARKWIPELMLQRLAAPAAVGDDVPLPHHVVGGARGVVETLLAAAKRGRGLLLLGDVFLEAVVTEKPSAAVVRGDDGDPDVDGLTPFSHRADVVLDFPSRSRVGKRGDDGLQVGRMNVRGARQPDELRRLVAECGGKRGIDEGVAALGIDEGDTLDGFGEDFVAFVGSLQLAQHVTSVKRQDEQSEGGQGGDDHRVALTESFGAVRLGHERRLVLAADQCVDVGHPASGQGVGPIHPGHPRRRVAGPFLAESGKNHAALGDEKAHRRIDLGELLEHRRRMARRLGPDDSLALASHRLLETGVGLFHPAGVCVDFPIVEDVVAGRVDVRREPLQPVERSAEGHGPLAGLHRRGITLRHAAIQQEHQDRRPEHEQGQSHVEVVELFHGRSAGRPKW